MANSFNLNAFLQEYKSYNTKAYTAVEAGKKAQEEREIKKAEEAVSGNFLSLTLREKLLELGIGERVGEQIKQTAIGTVTGIVNPFLDYLKKYENVLDQDKYNQKIQEYGLQMLYQNLELEKLVASEKVGKNLVIDM